MTTIKEAYENGCQLALYELRKFAAETEGPTVGERGMGAVGGGVAGSGLGAAAGVPLMARGHFRAGLAAPIIGGVLGTGIGAGLTPESTSTGGAYGMAGGAALGGALGAFRGHSGAKAVGEVLKQTPGVAEHIAPHLKQLGWHGAGMGGIMGAGLGGLAGLGLGSLAGMPGWFKSND